MSTDASASPIKPIEWLLLAVIFLLAGTLGHDPWKQDETYSFGIIYHFYTTHSWLIPMNAGAPFMEKPPLYYWTAVLFCKLLGGTLPLHDAARLASVFYTMLACFCLWATAHALFAAQPQKKIMGQVTLALFLGSLGVMRHTHDMFTDVALLAGTCAALLGLALLLCRPEEGLRAGLICGIGTGIAFLTKGLFVPVVLGASGAMLLVLLPQLRVQSTVKFLLMALLAASPFLVIWPGLLYLDSPMLFTQWFWDNNVGRFLGFTVDRLGAGNKPYYMPGAVLWFAFPAFPLACLWVVCKRRQWRRPEYLLPLVFAIVGFAFLLSSASARALYLLPLVPAFALLAAQMLMRIPPPALTKWNLVVRILASLGGLIVVTIWFCLLYPAGPQPLAKLYGQWLPLGFLPGDQTVAYLAALVLVLLWFASFRLKASDARQTAYLWLLGLTLLWGLANTLLLPWIDETRSFRPVIAEINAVVSQPAYANDCIARHDLGESTSPMWEYFGAPRGLGPVEGFEGTHCRLLLLMTGKSMVPVSDARWHLIWKGSRVLDGKDELQLYERNAL
jgi:4-amino-4-deoxy-L-arabinose transferase-like glycosyltransferase